MVWTLANVPGGAAGAGHEMAASPVVGDPLCLEAVALLRLRFAETANDAPATYAAFLGVAGDRELTARLRLEAVETIRVALEAFDTAGEFAG